MHLPGDPADPPLNASEVKGGGIEMLISHIDLRVGGLEWLAHAVRETIDSLSGKEDLSVKALLGLVVSLDPEHVKLFDEEATYVASLIKENRLVLAAAAAADDLSEEEWREEVAILKEDLNLFRIHSEPIEDRLGEIIDLEYELVDRLLVFTFATIYDSYLSGGIEGNRGDLLKSLLNEFWYEGFTDLMPTAALSIGHLDHMLREENASPLQEAIKNLTSRVRWDLL